MAWPWRVQPSVSSASKCGFTKAIFCRPNVVRRARYSRSWLHSQGRFHPASGSLASAVVATVPAPLKALRVVSAARGHQASALRAPRASVRHADQVSALRAPRVSEHPGRRENDPRVSGPPGKLGSAPRVSEHPGRRENDPRVSGPPGKLASERPGRRENVLHVRLVPRGNAPHASKTNVRKVRRLSKRQMFQLPRRSQPCLLVKQVLLLLRASRVDSLQP